MMDSIVSAQSHIRDGRVRALAVSGTKRSSSLPQVPTFTEAGIDNLALSNWFGFFAPAGTPTEVVQRLHRELDTIVRSSDVSERLVSLGAEPAPSAPSDAFARLVRAEHEDWKALIERARIKAE
jgi:tripartite-type tricarboxylate transporter receptor subunit TctC